MPIRWRVALFGAGLVMLAMLGFSVLVFALAALGAADQRDRELTVPLGAGRASPSSRRPSRRRLAARPLAAARRRRHDRVRYVLVDGAPRTTPAHRVPETVLRDAAQRAGPLATLDRGVRRRRCGCSVSRRGRARRRPVRLRGRRARRAAVQDPTGRARGFLCCSGLATSDRGAASPVWLAAGRALRPLDTVARLMDEIGRSTRDLGPPAAAPPARDEVGRLTAASTRCCSGWRKRSHGSPARSTPSGASSPIRRTSCAPR